MNYIKFNKKNIFFILLFLLPERMFFLVNQSGFERMFRIKYTDFVMIIYFIVFVYVVFKYKVGSINEYYFANNLLLILPLVGIASLVAEHLFDQSANDTFWAQRPFFMMIFSYFIFRTLMRNKVVTKEYLWNIIYKLSFWITGVIIIQHTLSNFVHVLSVRYQSRFGVRITDNYTYATILFIGSLLLFFNSISKKDKLISTIGLIMSYYHCVFVSQTRIVMIAYGVLTIIAALFFTHGALNKITYLFVAIGLILILSQTSLGQYFLTAILDSSTDSSSRIREIGRFYYMLEIVKSPMFGRGYPLNYEASLASGSFDKIYLVDNGIIAFAYLYGVVGLIWYIFLIIKMLLGSFKCIKSRDYKFILYTLFLQIICVNIIWWYWRFSFGIIFTLMLAFMEEYNVEKFESKVKFYFGG